ncbi:MAG: GNAT family N-acetyltransferase [Streptosporangiales bacterium]|nr:GNAT family N-acetyltransferase [Streptosporangiales bacterium]
MVVPATGTVDSVRAFNRFYTRVIGVLADGLNQTPYSLTEARVLYDLGLHDELDVVELRHQLDIDAGYLTRILNRLGERGLLVRRRSAADGRRQVVALTDAGRDERRLLDARSNDDVTALLNRLSDAEQRRLVHAMDTVHGLLDEAEREAAPAVQLRDAGPGDLGWVVERNGAVYAEEFGWDHSYEALVAKIVADFAHQHAPARERVWIAEADGVRVGCVFCVRGDDDATAKLRLLLVEPSARGLGVGKRLVEACVEFARSVGYQRMVLWTNSVLVAARAIYRQVGFELTDSAPHHSFGKDLVGETWTLDLTCGRSAGARSAAVVASPRR